MATIASLSERYNPRNEDFDFAPELSHHGAHLLVVGDFARSSYEGLDELAKHQLSKILDDQTLASLALPDLLLQITLLFNNQLTMYRNRHQKSDPDKIFQCCLAIAALKNARLYYLTRGDCRIAVRRGDQIILLNGTIWLDTNGNPLPRSVSSLQEMRPGNDPPPWGALGTGQIEVSQLKVEEFALQSDDEVLLYSDGVDKAISPAQLLGILRQRDPAESLNQTVAEILRVVRESNRGTDDRTLLIATGPHEDLEQETQRTTEERLTRLTDKVADVEINQLEWLKEIKRDTATTLAGINEKLSSIAQLKTILEELRSDKQKPLSLNSLLSAITDIQKDLSDLLGPKPILNKFRDEQKKPNLVNLLRVINDLPENVFSERRINSLGEAICNKLALQTPQTVSLTEEDYRLLESVRTALQQPLSLDNEDYQFLSSVRDALQSKNQSLEDSIKILTQYDETLKDLISHAENSPKPDQIRLTMTDALVNSKPPVAEEEEEQISQPAIEKIILSSGQSPTTSASSVPDPSSPMPTEPLQQGLSAVAHRSPISQAAEKSPPETQSQPENIHHVIHNFWSSLSPRRKVVIGIIIVALILIIAYALPSLLTNKNTTPDITSSMGSQSSAGAQKRFRLIQNGQRIQFEDSQSDASNTIGYIVNPGPHSNLKDGVSIESDAEAYKWLADNVAEVLLFKPPLKLPQNYWVYPVIKQDFDPFTATNSSGKKIIVQNACAAFLARINKSTPTGVRMGVQELRSLNKLSESCDTLKEGQLLIVRYQQ